MLTQTTIKYLWDTTPSGTFAIVVQRAGYTQVIRGYHGGDPEARH